MVTYYLNDYGFVQPFQVFQSDGTTVYDLTSTIVTWLFKNNAVTPATTQTIVGVLTNPSQGQVSFTIPLNFFNIVAKWDCQLQISGAGLQIHTDPPFVVEILASES